MCTHINQSATSQNAYIKAGVHRIYSYKTTGDQSERLLKSRPTHINELATSQNADIKAGLHSMYTYKLVGDQSECLHKRPAQYVHIKPVGDLSQCRHKSRSTQYVHT